MLFYQSSKPQFSTALITGASSGLGKALAALLREKKIPLILTGRSDPFLPLDLTQINDRKTLCALIEDKTPDLIIHNAGFGLYGDTLSLPLSEQLEMIQLHITALMEISWTAAHALVKKKKPGVILAISSAAAFFPFPFFNSYASSKRFALEYCQALDQELRSSHIRVLCSCPGQINTSFRKRASKGFAQKIEKRTLSAEKGALFVWKQIEKRKPLMIFDWKTKALVFLGRCLPKRWIGLLLQKTIQKRINIFN